MMKKREKIKIQRAYTARILEEIRRAEQAGHDVRPSDIKEEIKAEMEAKFGPSALDALC